MEVVAPPPEFHFHAARISPPASPPNNLSNNTPFFEFRHHRHVSAPNSPTSAAKTYAAFRDPAAATRGSRHSSVPFDWEEKPGTPKFPSCDEKDDDFDLEFDFSFGFGGRQIDRSPQQPAETEVAADELFELGKIRPLKLPPRLYAPVMGEQGPKSPRIGGGLLSPLRRGRNQRDKELDPFVVAMMEATRSRKGSRSLSPLGGRGKGGNLMSPASSPPRNPALMVEKGGWGWKSRLKELLLFRSSSEGPRLTGERKRDDFSKSGSSSSSSSNSSVAPQEMVEEGPENGTAAVMEKKAAVVPYKQSMFSVRSSTIGKFGASFIRRRT